jgi:hypothetical protein
MDELELIYRHFKPSSGDNFDGNKTNVFPGTQESGFNPSSDPTGSAYTALDPSQTTFTDFQAPDEGTGGPESFDEGSYWVSTDADEESQAWAQRFTSNSGFQGQQYVLVKDNSVTSVRPVRRVPV